MRFDEACALALDEVEDKRNKINLCEINVKLNNKTYMRLDRYNFKPKLDLTNNDLGSDEIRSNKWYLIITTYAKERINEQTK